MSKLIPQNFIDDLLSKIDIATIIGERVKLKRSGSNLVGLCPFHTEKTPSFTVSQNKQFFHCFGCGAHGSAISFIMQFEHLGFVEAVENLASQAGMTIPQSKDNKNEPQYTNLYKTTEMVATFFEKELTKSPRAIDYLKSRGLTGKICKNFKIGYAPNDWNNLKPLYYSSAITKQQMTTAGILITKNDKTYSRFRDRIIFPIRNTRGQIIGFGGRAIDKDPAKYLNSPETPIFHKGEELYGIYEAKKAYSTLNSLIVVEGYMDVIALAQFGITNVVATLGTAISTKQIQLMLRHTTEIVFCFDGDPAGHTAAWRALENSLPLMRDGIQIKFLFLPNAEDPDSLIRKESKKIFDQLLAQAMPLSDFFIKRLLGKININTIDGKAKFTQTGKALLKKMPQGIFHQLLSKKIAELANVNVEELQNREIDRSVIESPATLSNDYNTIPLLIQNTISILLHNPQFISHIDNSEAIATIKLQGIEILQELFTLLKKQPNITLGAILEYWRDRQELDFLNKLVCKEPIIPKDILKNELSGIIQLLLKLEQEILINDLLTKAAVETLSGDERQKLQNLIAISKK